MTYAEKLRDPRWQKKRLQILERDGWKCCCCDTETKSLQVHHVVYRRIDPWEYPDHCYQTLCEDCHKERQDLTDKAVDAVRLRIKDLPTQRINAVVQRLIDSAMENMEVGK